MITFGNQKIEDWVATRILNFLNYTRDAASIVETVKDDPNSGAPGEGAAIGETVAARILAKRNSLPNRRFSEISELEGIQGFGEDKMRDLIFTFGVRAADAFRDGLFTKQILLENWNLEHHTHYFRTEEELNLIATSKSNLADFIGQEVKKLVAEKKQNKLAGDLAEQIIQGLYQDRHDISHLSSYIFAFWFYQFDQDNWFSFERIRVEIEQYLSYYLNPDDDLALVMFRDFPTGLTLTEGITPNDLLVVINRPERAISIWTAELFD